MKLHFAGGVVLSSLLFAGTVSAGTINWTNSSGGAYSDGANWEGGAAPAASDSASFTNAGNYTVTLGAPAVVSNLLVNADASLVTFDLAGNSLSPTNALYVGSVSGRVSEAVVSNGAVIARALQIGAAGAKGTLTYRGVSNRITAAGGLVVGSSGTGQLVLADSASSLHATAGGSHYVGQNSGSVGALTLQGSYLNLTNSSLYCGNYGTGTLDIQSGTGFVSVLYLGNATGSKGVLSMSGTGAYLEAGINLGNAVGAESELYLSNGLLVARGATKFCIDGRTLMMLNGGSITQDTGNTYLPHYAGTGTLVLASAESTFYLGGSLAIGQNVTGGRGDIYVTNGTVNAFSIALANTASSLGSLFIYNGTTVVRNAASSALTVATGVNSTGVLVMADSRATLISSNSSIVLGGSGYGSLTISNGSIWTKGLTLGSNSGSTGRVRIDAGAVAVFTNNLTVGASGAGSLTLAGPDTYLANNIGTPATQLGGNTGGAGSLYASNGTLTLRQLQVGGNGWGYMEIGASTVSVSDVLLVPNNTALQQYGNGADADVGYDGSSYTVLVSSVTNSWIGDIGGGQKRNATLVIQLPSSRPTNSSALVSLAFRLNEVSAVARNFNVDLYGIRSSSSSTVLTNDYSGGVLLQNDIMVPSSATGTLFSVSAAGTNAISAWVNSLYDAGAVAGDYLFFGLRFDSTPDDNSYYQIHTANSAARANQPYSYFGYENGATGLLVLTSGQSLMTVSNTVRVGSAGVASKGTIVISNGTLQARAMEVGGIGDGWLTVLDGSILQNSTLNTDGLRLGCNAAGGTGTVVLAHPNALINTPSNGMILGYAANSGSRLIISNGTVLVKDLQMGGSSNDKTNSFSEITILDGSLTTTSTTFQCGVGRSTTTRIVLGHPNARLGHPNSTCFIGFGTNSSASLVMSNGSFSAQSIQMGSNPTFSPPGQYGEWIIYNATGTLRNAGGTGIWLAGQPRCTGVMVLAHAGAFVDCTNNVLVGDSGDGTLIVSNGLLTAANLTLGSATGSVGRMQVSGGRVEVSTTLTVANRGDSVLKVSGGVIVATNLAIVGQTTATNIPATFELSGGTVLVSRIYSLTAIGAQSNLWLSGGALAAAANFTNSLNMTLTNSPGPGLVTVETSFTNLFTGLLSGPGGLAKSGPGRLALSQDNSYTGETVVREGTLILHTNATLAGSTQITVAAGAVLDVTNRTDKTLALGAGQTLKGNGTVVGVLANAGVIAPGGSAGTLYVSRDYTQSGALRIEVGGVTPGSGHDVLAVSSNATLSGALEVSLINGFVPANGNSFTVLTASAVSGTFATTNLPALGGGAAWTVDYQADKVVLSVTGGGGSPILGVSPASLNFGAVKVGEYSELTFTVTNSGSSQLEGTATVSGVSFTVQSGSPFSVVAGGSASVTVRLTPTATAGYSGNTIFASNGGDTNNSVSGSGYVQATATNSSMTLVSGQPTFGFSLASGGLYRVQATTNLLDGSGWVDLTDHLTNNYPGGIIPAFTETNTAANPRRAYRISSP